ncbi:hypothetical protein E2C01_003663 [Portunus trituberculatus]|uniref:Uncharacterized protein n=1 Tax=Portunus trituberculatus TaxID=210409 RepID=A0A5B7CNA9_PORTR|nr:hypothetical protein [Portunus trituberculatus]
MHEAHVGWWWPGREETVGEEERNSSFVIGAGDVRRGKAWVRRREARDGVSVKLDVWDVKWGGSPTSQRRPEELLWR